MKILCNVMVILLFLELSAACSGAKVEMASDEGSSPAARGVPLRTPENRLRDGNMDDVSVRPGVGIDQARIGMQKREIIDYLGTADSEVSYSQTCRTSHLQWVKFPKDQVGDGIFAFLRNDKVFELRFGDGFTTLNGVKAGSLVNDVSKHLPAPYFRLTNSASTATNEKDLIFSIDTVAGIAYEIGTRYKDGKLIVNALYVFSPGEDFQPWGCIDANQRLLKTTD